jgi:uncharacterized protein YqgV (UPF0045/DUF77 family)
MNPIQVMLAWGTQEVARSVDPHWVGALTFSSGDGKVHMIGCRFAIYPMTDNFVEVILSAVRDMETDGMTVRTDSLGTLLVGEEDQVFDAVRGAFARAATHGGHVVMTLHLSRGCPGEPEGYCNPQGGPMA